MDRTTRSLLTALGAFAVGSLACAPLNKNDVEDEPAAGPASMCGRDGALLTSLTPATRDSITAACMVTPAGEDEGDEDAAPTCDATSAPCKATFTYALQHLELDRWFSDHADASGIALYDGYIDAYLRPLLDTHDELWSTQRILSAREALGDAPTILRVEGKDYSDAFLRKIRASVKEVESDDERALLIDAYTNLKLLNALALSPRGELDPWRDDVRVKLETHERLKAKLEILELDPPSRPEPTPEPEPADPQPDSPDTPAEPDTPPPPPSESL